MKTLKTYWYSADRFGTAVSAFSVLPGETRCTALFFKRLLAKVHTNHVLWAGSWATCEQVTVSGVAIRRSNFDSNGTYTTHKCGRGPHICNANVGRRAVSAAAHSSVCILLNTPNMLIGFTFVCWKRWRMQTLPQYLRIALTAVTNVRTGKE